MHDILAQVCTKRKIPSMLLKQFLDDVTIVTHEQVYRQKENAM